MILLAPASAPVVGAAPARMRGRSDAVALGIVGALVTLAGVQVPDLWRDEVATVGAAERSWPALLAMAGRVDAVHALYYAGMHVWFGLVGYSPLTLRLPSVLAVGGTAAAVTLLGRRLGGRRVGRATGAVAAVLPALVWAGGEGRSSALTALLAALGTLALLHALRLVETGAAAPRRVAAWAGYAGLVALTGALFVDTLLLVPAHLATVLVLGGRRRLPAFFAALAVAVAAVLPLVALAAAQGGQVSWIPVPDLVTTPHQVAVEQWFRSDAVAGVVLALLVAGLVSAVLRVRLRMRRPLPPVGPTGSTAGGDAAPARRALLAVALPWAVLPTGLLLAASAVHAPLYWPRYVLFTAPAVALLVGAALAVLPGVLPIAGLLALALVATPQIVADRQPRAKADTEIGLAARLVAAARAESPPGGRAGIVYGQYDYVQGLTTGMTAVAYPDAFRGLVDLTALRPIGTSTTLFEPRETPSQALPRMRRLDTVWFLLDLDSTPKTTIPVAGLHALGFTETARFRDPGSLLLRWDREP